jgi:hypothetical protein
MQSYQLTRTQLSPTPARCNHATIQVSDAAIQGITSGPSIKLNQRPPEADAKIASLTELRGCVPSAAWWHRASASSWRAVRPGLQGQISTRISPPAGSMLPLPACRVWAAQGRGGHVHSRCLDRGRSLICVHSAPGSESLEHRAMQREAHRPLSPTAGGRGSIRSAEAPTWQSLEAGFYKKN